ncbi:hypothetical protein PtB15_12B8 [Puccinia triticina]|nr:hypothetical protein PtB15_12B8 [Puccinia triticina]
MMRVSLLSMLILFASLSRTESRGALSRRQRGAGGASPTFEITSQAAKAQAQLAQRRALAAQRAGLGGKVKVVPMTAEIEGFAIQFKVSGSDEDLQPAAKAGALIRASAEQATADSSGGKGINLVLHGDGGQSFFDFPNKGEHEGLLGVVALAPNDKMFWGGVGYLYGSNSVFLIH